jgi:hypothetical protein
MTAWIELLNAARFMYWLTAYRESHEADGDKSVIDSINKSALELRELGADVALTQEEFEQNLEQLLKSGMPPNSTAHH